MTVRDLVRQERFDEAWTLLREQAGRTSDYTEFLSLCRWHRRLSAQAPRENGTRLVRIALLGGATTELLEGPLALAVEALGLRCEILRGEYNAFAREMLEPDGPIVAFKPDVAVVVNTPHNLHAWPAPGDDVARVRELAEEACAYWFGLCERLHAHAGCEIVLNNFHPLPSRPLGNLGARLPWDPNNFLRRLNREMGDRAPGFVHINDVESLAGQYGVDRWFDARYWFHAKHPVSFECAVPYVRNIARLVGALFGRTAKCLVLDLDNTIWGGVVGDDGVAGLTIGEGDPLGEAFKAFQQYALQLKQRGVLLAVCSKNEDANARAVFRERPEMVLKLEDFACFKANWRPKPDNLREIAAELNIGLDSLVFVDDNPAEREHVRQWLPEVRVVDLTEDPADYPRLLDLAGHFEVASITAEDALRTLQYQENARRRELQTTVTDYAAYLASLEQRAVVRPFEELQLDRITQLVNKSNQFNLTTIRMTRAEIEAAMRDPEAVTATVRLADRFGDNGLITVFLGRRDGDALRIDEWLMSCRVLNRGVERLLLNHVVAEAARRGLRALGGRYVPTAKNGLVRDHFRSLGFAPAGEDEHKTTHWRLEVNGYRPSEPPITIVEDY